MKTMKRGTDIVRVKNEKYKEYEDKGYSYVPKSVWKAQKNAK
jgi:hypothetical protein